MTDKSPPRKSRVITFNTADAKSILEIIHKLHTDVKDATEDAVKLESNMEIRNQSLALIHPLPTDAKNATEDAVKLESSAEMCNGLLEAPQKKPTLRIEMTKEVPPLGRTNITRNSETVSSAVSSDTKA